MMDQANTLAAELFAELSAAATTVAGHGRFVGVTPDEAASEAFTKWAMHRTHCPGRAGEHCEVCQRWRREEYQVKVVKNTALNLVRGATRRRAHEGLAGSRPIPSDTLGVSEEVIAAEVEREMEFRDDEVAALRKKWPRSYEVWLLDPTRPHAEADSSHPGGGRR